MSRVNVMKQGASALWWGLMLAHVAQHRITGEVVMVVPLDALGYGIVVGPKGIKS